MLKPCAANHCHPSFEGWTWTQSTSSSATFRHFHFAAKQLSVCFINRPFVNRENEIDKWNNVNHPIDEFRIYSIDVTSSHVPKKLFQMLSHHHLVPYCIWMVDILRSMLMCNHALGALTKKKPLFHVKCIVTQWAVPIGRNPLLFFFLSSQSLEVNIFESSVHVDVRSRKFSINYRNTMFSIRKNDRNHVFAFFWRCLTVSYNCHPSGVSTWGACHCLKTSSWSATTSWPHFMCHFAGMIQIYARAHLCWNFPNSATEINNRHFKQSYYDMTQ